MDVFETLKALHELEGKTLRHSNNHGYFFDSVITSVKVGRPCKVRFEVTRKGQPSEEGSVVMSIHALSRLVEHKFTTLGGILNLAVI